MNNVAIRAAVVGATGYTGQEVLRLLKRHPRFRASYATSEREAGGEVRGTALRYVAADSVPFERVDVVFCCLPTGESGPVALRAHESGARVVDLSADLRTGSGGAVYGLPELWRAAVREASLVANPGCYPTGILLALAPLAAAGLLDPTRPVIVNAASGVTGAGRSAKRDLLFAEVADDYRAYGVGNRHRHVPEIAAGLRRAAGADVPFVFTPHLLPVRRGILETIYLPLLDGVNADSAARAAAATYAEERFVAVEEALPTLRDVVHTNRVALGFSDVEVAGPPLALCVVAFDNLLKGAAGQAVQNANLMFGLCEAEGLEG